MRSLAFSVVLVAVFSYGVARLLMMLGINRRVYNHLPGECTTIGSIEGGVVDMEGVSLGQLWPAAQPASALFLTSGLNLTDRQNPQGRLYLYHPANKSAWQLVVQSKTLKGINPEGLSVFEESDRDPMLFVVNHRPQADTVEVFSYNKNRHALAHLRTIRSPLFTKFLLISLSMPSGLSLKDVVAVSREKFYVTCHSFFSNPYLAMAERLLALPLGSIVFYNGHKAEKVASWLSTPVGIVSDIQRRQLYVASYGSESVVRYSLLSAADPRLNKTKEFHLETSPFFLWMEKASDYLYVAAHPVRVRHANHQIREEEFFAPTQVLRFYTKGQSSRKPKVEELLANDGASISAATSALRIGPQLLLGGPRSSLMACALG